MTNRPAILGEMEARKLPTRQDKDGNFIISFSVHPDDARAKPDLLTAAPGTPFAVRYCTIDYDNPEPQERKKREPVPFDELKPSQQAGILCADLTFQDYLSKRWFMCIVSEDEAASALRDRMNISSRSALDTNKPAAIIWREIVADFRDWQRTDARYKDTPAYEKQRAANAPPKE